MENKSLFCWLSSSLCLFLAVNIVLTSHSHELMISYMLQSVSTLFLFLVWCFIEGNKTCRFLTEISSLHCVLKCIHPEVVDIVPFLVRGIASSILEFLTKTPPSWLQQMSLEMFGLPVTLLRYHKFPPVLTLEWIQMPWEMNFLHAMALLWWKLYA